MNANVNQVQFELTIISQCAFNLALAAHNIECQDTITIDFFDNNKTPILNEDIFDIVGQKINSSCFFVELRIGGDHFKKISSAVSESRLHTVFLFFCFNNLTFTNVLGS